MQHQLLSQQTRALSLKSVCYMVDPRHEDVAQTTTVRFQGLKACVPGGSSGVVASGWSGLTGADHVPVAVCSLCIFLLYLILCRPLGSLLIARRV
jgi:hypothetical protein